MVLVVDLIEKVVKFRKYGEGEGDGVVVEE